MTGYDAFLDTELDRHNERMNFTNKMQAHSESFECFKENYEAEIDADFPEWMEKKGKHEALAVWIEVVEDTITWDDLHKNKAKNEIYLSACQSWDELAQVAFEENYYTEYNEF